MAIIAEGQYLAIAPTLTNAQYTKLRTDVNGNLLTREVAQALESFNLNAGTGSTTGLCGTVLNTGKIYVALDCSATPVSGADWGISSDQQYTYQLFRSRQNELTATITLTDATAVDADDTFILNGLTFTAKTSGAVVANREYNLGADNAAAAVNLAALLTNATYGVPGIAIAITSPTTTDVLTITCTTATTLHFAQGSSAASEIAWVDNTLANLWVHAVVSGNTAANSTTRGLIVNQATVNGWPWCYLCLTNTSGSAAATFAVRAIRY